MGWGYSCICILGTSGPERLLTRPEADTERNPSGREVCSGKSLDPFGQEILRVEEKIDGGIPLRFPSTLPALSSGWRSNEVAGRDIEIEEPLSLRVPRDVCGRDIADAGRAPYPMVFEKVPLCGRVVVEPARDVVEDAYELPRVRAWGAPTIDRVRGACLFVSLTAVGFIRVAIQQCQRIAHHWYRRAQEGQVRETALFAMVPGGRIPDMPDRAFVVAEFISRSPAWGMRDRVDARG